MIQQLYKRRELFEKIGDYQAGVERAKRKFLFESGWKHTCDTPGRCWVWIKDWDHSGKTTHLMATMDEAVKMEYVILNALIAKEYE